MTNDSGAKSATCGGCLVFRRTLLSLLVLSVCTGLFLVDYDAVDVSEGPLARQFSVRIHDNVDLALVSEATVTQVATRLLRTSVQPFSLQKMNKSIEDQSWYQSGQKMWQEKSPKTIYIVNWAPRERIWTHYSLMAEFSATLCAMLGGDDALLIALDFVPRLFYHDIVTHSPQLPLRGEHNTVCEVDVDVAFSPHYKCLTKASHFLDLEYLQRQMRKECGNTALFIAERNHSAFNVPAMVGIRVASLSKTEDPFGVRNPVPTYFGDYKGGVLKSTSFTLRALDRSQMRSTILEPLQVRATNRSESRESFDVLPQPQCFYARGAATIDTERCTRGVFLDLVAEAKVAPHTRSDREILALSTSESNATRVNAATAAHDAAQAVKLAIRDAHKKARIVPARAWHTHGALLLRKMWIALYKQIDELPVLYARLAKSGDIEHLPYMSVQVRTNDVQEGVPVTRASPAHSPAALAKALSAQFHSVKAQENGVHAWRELVAPAAGKPLLLVCSDGGGGNHTAALATAAFVRALHDALRDVVRVHHRDELLQSGVFLPYGLEDDALLNAYVHSHAAISFISSEYATSDKPLWPHFVDFEHEKQWGEHIVF